MLAVRSVASGTDIGEALSRGGVSFLATGADAMHQYDVTQAGIEFPIKDTLSRLPELDVQDPETIALITSQAKGCERSEEAGDS